MTRRALAKKTHSSPALRATVHAHCMPSPPRAASTTLRGTCQVACTLVNSPLPIIFGDLSLLERRETPIFLCGRCPRIHSQSPGPAVLLYPQRHCALHHV